VEELFEAHAIDAVCHFAAESHVDRSILGPGQPPFASLRSGPKAPSRPSRQKQIPSNKSCASCWAKHFTSPANRSLPLSR
jgi:hypothetical protein